MKRSVALAVAALATMLSVGVAVATPATGFVSTLLARTTSGAISTTQTAGTDAVIQEVTLAPGGYTGWHSHTGSTTVVMVESGTFTIYHGPEHGKPHSANACDGTDYAAGRTAVEAAGDVHLGMNNSATAVVLTVVYLAVPAGAPVRVDETAPECAEAAGLTTGSAASGITAALLNRANFATAASIVGADEHDVAASQNSIALGGHSGWHAHPGATVVTVKSGTVTFYEAATCKGVNYTAGQGFVEIGGTNGLARNEGTVPAVVVAAFFDVPVGGALRIDQPEPSNCKGLAAVPAAAAVASAPNTAALAAPGSTSPVSPVPFLLLALAACLGAIGLSRGRQRR